MKLAYLITAYDNPNHLRKLIDTLQSDDVYFFIHIDKKSQMKFEFPEAKNVVVLKDRVTVFWGSHTFNEAVQKLIKKSFEFGPFDYYILLSGTDYPARSNEYIKKFIENNKDTQFINISKMLANNKSLDRVHYYYISEYDKSMNPLFIGIRILNELIRRLKIKRQLPEKYRGMTLYGGSTWRAMSGDAIRYMMEFIVQNPEFVEFYRNTLIPEEMFVHTIIGNSPFMKKTLPSFTYADWPTNNLAHPVMIDEKHIPILNQEKVPSSYGKEAYVLFARKFSDKNPSITMLIDSNMR
jgi:hypothetical protein